MVIKRDSYLESLVSKIGNRRVKILTGIRRCGKTFLLFELFRRHLLSTGVDEDHIITLALDDIANKEFRDAERLYRHVANQIKGSGKYFILLDEIQFVQGFEDALNGFLHIPDAEVYVTGSNARFLSKDIITEFRGRGDEVRIRPLSFSEYLQTRPSDMAAAWRDYSTFGGLPEVVLAETPKAKRDLLEHMFKNIYISDIVQRNRIAYPAELDAIIDFLCSSVGSLTNPLKIVRSLNSAMGSTISYNETRKYLEYLCDAFLFEEARRYDVKGKRYFSSIDKFYCEDIGLRNVRIGFRQMDASHIMENIIYNELRMRGWDTDVGVVETTETVGGKRTSKRLEIDFVANTFLQRVYIQSVLNQSEEAKRIREKRPLLKVPDSFKKIIVTADDIRLKVDWDGIITVNIIDFLTRPQLLDL